MTDHVLDDPSGLSPRARRFVQANGVRTSTWPVERHRRHWTDLGRPPAAIDQLIAHQQRWGGLVLPPAAAYEGGPLDLDADDPDHDDDGLVFTVGRPRYAVPYTFAVDEGGRFGICGSDYPWVPLHACIDGWVESLALTYTARETARLVRRIVGGGADDLLTSMAGHPPIAAVAGLADNWWQLPDGLLSITRGESLFFGGHLTTALRYEGAHEDA